MNDLTFVSPPRISRAQFIRVLARAKSPAAKEADRCYQICVDAGLDPAIALAFFRKESSYGTEGKARKTINWGNLRKGQGHQLRNADGWAWYATWADSLADWCALITSRYVGRGLSLLGPALLDYAPESDGNNPVAYAALVRELVGIWQAEDPERQGKGDGTQMRVKRMATRLREKPNTTSSVVKMLPAGEIVTVISVTNGERITETVDDPATGLNEIGTSSIVWYHVRLSNGKTGYIWSRLLERVE